MNPSIQKLTDFLTRPPKSLSSKTLSQFHTQLITTGLLKHLFQSNPSPFHLTKQLSNPQFAISSFKILQTVKPSSSISFNDPFVYASLIKACDKVYSIREGKSVHCHVVRLGLEWNVYILNSLVYFYSNSGKLIEYACAVFDEIPEKTIVSVNCMISGFLKNNLFDSGLSLFNRVSDGYYVNLKSNFVTFVIMISGCCEHGKFFLGKLLHSYCCKTGLGFEHAVGNAFVNLYAKFECINEAAMMFYEIPIRDLVSWNTMIGGYAQNNDCRKAFEIFRKMRAEDIEYDSISMSSLISACANSRDANMGKMVHGYVKVRKVESIASIGIALINMYSKCGLIDLAQRVFEERPSDNIAYVNSMIYGYNLCGHFSDALKLFSLIKSRNLVPNEVTILGFISACRGSGELHHGIDIHTYIDNLDHLNKSIVLCNALLDMYAKCGNMTLARSLFDKMETRDVISWTSIVVGYALNGEGHEAMVAFREMGEKKIEPNSITFIGVFLACVHAGLVEEGKKLFDVMCKEYHIKPRVEHFGCMVDMHARAGMLEEAHEFVKSRLVEPNAVIWRMLVNACRVHCNFNMGLSLVSGFKEVKALPMPEDYVISSNIFAETGRWNDVLCSRSLMVEEESSKVAGKSFIEESTVLLLGENNISS